MNQSFNAKNIVWQNATASAEERATTLRQKPVTLWMTGLSGAGKSTLAFALERRLIQQGHAS
ncbi:adenylyl-sulfate kinase, partial [Streptococcus suis]